MLTDIKYLKYIKLLCWSNKVKVGSAVFMTMKFVFLLLGGANLDTVIFYRTWMSVLCPLFLMHVLLLLSGGVVVRVFSSLIWVWYSVHLLMCRVGWACVPLSLYVLLLYFYVVRPTCTGDLLLTCRVVERCVDILCRGYGWFSVRISAAVCCSGSLIYALCHDGSFMGRVGVLTHVRTPTRPTRSHQDITRTSNFQNNKRQH